MTKEYRFRKEDAQSSRRALDRTYGWLKREVAKEQSTPQLRQRIGGTEVAPASGEYLDNIDPATSEVLCKVPRGSKADVDAAVAAASKAQKAWAATPLAKRCAILAKAADIIERDAERLVKLESGDTGKPVKLASSLDIPRAARNFRFYSEYLLTRKEPEFEDGAWIHKTMRNPVGVIGLVTPWNLPLYLLTWKVAPALGLGNAVVAKPSEMTPRTADALADILDEAGLPAGLYNVVHGLGPEAGEPLVSHPHIDAVSFTGGTATGKRVALAAAGKKLSLELGGKNPAVVFADCDLDAAVAGTVRGGFTNGGQICLCTSRILVEESIFPEFQKKFVAAVKNLKVGDPRDATTDVGPLVSQAHREKVEGYLALARKEGKILCGGERPKLHGGFAKGSFLTPAVVVDVRQDSRCVQEEVFGPVVTLQPFSSEDEALALANDVPYGLSSSVWTKDLTKASRVAARIESGLVWINSWLVRDLRVPFGGVKASGIGREGGEWSVDFYSEAKSVTFPAPPAKPAPRKR